MQQGVKATRKSPEVGRDSRWTVLVPTAKGGTVDHALDWLDAGDGFFGEGEAESDSPEQFTVDINRAAAHTLQNAGLGERAAAQASKDDGLPWAEILEDAEDLDLEVFDAIPLEDSSADSAKSRTDILDWEEILTRRQSG